MRCSGRPAGTREGDPRAATRPSLGPDPAAVQLDDAARDREPESRSGGGPRLLSPPEALEHAPLGLAVEPLAGVFDDDGHVRRVAFDANREVVLSQGVSRAPDPGFQGSARILEDEPDHLRIATSGGSSGWLVVIDTYDPGWRATVDGRPTDVVPANVAFRAVAVPAGSHVVALSYRPTSVLWGAGVFLVTVVASLVVLWRKK